MLSLPVRVQFATGENCLIENNSDFRNRQKLCLKGWLGRELVFGW